MNRIDITLHTSCLQVHINRDLRVNRSDERVDTASLRENKNIGRTCVC